MLSIVLPHTAYEDNTRPPARVAGGFCSALERTNISLRRLSTPGDREIAWRTHVHWTRLVEGRRNALG